MTCHQALSLLDDYLDDELMPSQVADLESHLASCNACRLELDSSRRLRTYLKESRETAIAPDPGDDFWAESQSLILAKTVDAEPHLTRITPVPVRTSSNRNLVRSAVLFAASVVLMFSALYIGSQREQIGSSLALRESPVLITASLSEVMGSDNTAIVTKEEENSLIRGLYALSAPGPVGRYAAINDLVGPR